MFFHIPENLPAGVSVPIVVLTPGRALLGGSIPVSGWPSGFTSFPKLVTALRSGALLGSFEVTAFSTPNLATSGPADGYADVALLAGDTLELRPMKEYFTELQIAVGTNTSAITTLQTSLTADEATLASHTTELASHATTLSADATAITSLQTSRTTDETTLASHTTELATLTTGLAGAVMLPYATNAQAAFPGFWISAWGDSLTFSETPVSYETYLAAYAYRSVFNGGIGGQTSTQIAARMLAATAQYSNSVIIWAGRNDAPNSISPTTTLANIASMVAALGHTRYLVLSIPNTSAEPSGSGLYNAIISLNASLASIYGAHYWDVRSYLVSQYNPSLPQDVIDHGNDVLPTSLRVSGDVLHPNNAGNALIAAFIAANFMTILNGDVLHPVDVAGLGPVLQLATEPIADSRLSANVPLLNAASNTFTGSVAIDDKLSVGSSGSDFFIQSGTMGMQSYATNNCWIGDNLFFNGGGFAYKANGYGCIAYFTAGGFSIMSAPYNTSGAGAAASPVTGIQVDVSGLFHSYYGFVLSDGANLTLGTVTGTKFGTATNQKQAWYGATPIVQPTGNALTALSNLGLCASPTLAETDVTNLTSDLALKAPLASPAFTGTPAAPTASPGTNTTQLATTAFVLANAGDLLSTLVNTPVSITGTTALTSSAFDHWHVCSGTSANYAVTLPAPATNAGKSIGLRMDAGLTKLVTITQHASETIDGAGTRIMWAGEAAVLLCDGTNWSKILGRALPMICDLKLVGAGPSTAQLVATGGAINIVVLLDTTVSDNTGLMADLTNNQILIARPGNYLVGMLAAWSATAIATLYKGLILDNGAATDYADNNPCSTAPSNPEAKLTGLLTLAAGDDVQLGVYQTSGVSQYLTRGTHLFVVEVPEW